MSLISATVALRSRTFLWSTCLRLKARSWRVREAARAAVFWMSSTFFRLGSSPLSRPRSSALRPVMIVRRLLKS